MKTLSLSKSKIRVVPYLGSLMGIALVLVGVWGIQQYQHKRQYRVYLENMVQRSIYELVDGMDNMQVDLSKLLVSDQPAGSTEILSDLGRVSELMQGNLGQLPMAHETIGDTLKFVNQLGDYCKSLERGIKYGKPLSDDDRAQIQSLAQQCASLNQSLQTAVGKGVTLDLYAPAYRVGSAQTAAQGDEGTLSEPGIEYPTLIYDGPFSDAAQNRTAKSLADREWIDYYKAVDIASAYLGENRIAQILGSAPYSGDVPAWGIEFVTQTGDKIAVYVSKQGGKVMWMLQETGTHTQTLSLETCRNNAALFLETRGYEGMVSSYSQYYDGIAVFNFAASQNGVILYPDLVKVQVSMQTGDVIGVEARNYVYNHIMRVDIEPTITAEQALLHTDRILIDGVRLCVIPMPDQSERLTWEVSGTYNEERYLVYINAHDGAQENIIKIIDTENGTMTM